MEANYLPSIRTQFTCYRQLAEKAIAQLSEEAIFWQPNEYSNSIAIILQHISGNLLSRFTDFLTSDGEKPWRNRDAEFEPPLASRQELMTRWDEGWACLEQVLDGLQQDDLGTLVYIRNQPHTVLEALHRQVAHYAYHSGQIVYIAKILARDNWQTLSIPRGESEAYNQKMK